MKILDSVTALTPERRALLWQLLRYGLTGVVVTAIQATIYWSLAALAHVHPQVANGAGYVAAVVLGYILHGVFTFRGHGARNGSGARAIRFVAVSLVSFGLNATWVGLAVSLMHWPEWTPIPAMMVVTPALVFLLNRQWVFR